MPVIKDELREQHKPTGRGVKPPSQTNLSSFNATNDGLVNNNNGTLADRSFTQSETDVIAFGNYVVVAFNDAGSYTGSNNKFTGWAYSIDGGTTFTDGGTLPTSTIGDAGDPVLARNETTGRIYLSTLGFDFPNTIQMWRSDNNGLSWMAPVNATPGGGGGYGEDKQWHTVDNFPGTGNGNVYLVTRNFGSGSGIFFYRSTDHGATFGPNGGINIVSGNQGAFVAVGPDHAVYVFWWASGSPTDFIRMRKSTDFGQTFGSPIDVATGLVGGINGDLGLLGRRNGTTTFSYFRSNSFAHVAINPASGHIYVTYNDDGPGTDKADVFLTISTDGGVTWTTRVRVNDDATMTDQWQPTIAVTQNGTGLGVFYFSRQDDPELNNLFKYYGRIGAIAGTTVIWSPSFAVSEIASLPEFGRDNVVNPNYMGDYNHVAATTGAFHVVWSDNRENHPLPGGAPRKDPNVYYRKVPIIHTTVFQKLQDGTQVGTIGKWNGSSFNPRFSSGQQLPFRVGSTEVLHGEISMFSSQKYHQWLKLGAADPDVKNHHVFDIESDFPNQLTSRFNPTDPTITIKTDLIDAPGTTGGDITFHDPWYIDYQDVQYGSNWRNRGMQEPRQFHTRSLVGQHAQGWQPDFTTTYSQGPYPYNGAFLLQGYPGWNPPYYSVGAPVPNDINGFTSYFLYWNGTNVQYQNASAAQTGVVFTNTGATATAKYKAHLGSSTAQATANPSQRKVVRDDQGNFHMAYSSAEYIWYCKSTDNGEHWSPEEVISQDASQPCKNPAISFGIVPWQIIVVWEGSDESGHFVYLRTMDNNGVWSAMQNVAEQQAYTTSAKPVVSIAYDVSQGVNHALIVWYDGVDESLKGRVRNGANGELQSTVALRSSQITEFSLNPIVYRGGEPWDLVWVEAVDGNTPLYFYPIHVDLALESILAPEMVYKGDPLVEYIRNLTTVRGYSGKPTVAWENDYWEFVIVAIKYSEKTGENWSEPTGWIAYYGGNYRSPSLTAHRWGSNQAIAWYSDQWGNAIEYVEYTDRWSDVNWLANGYDPGCSITWLSPQPSNELVLYRETSSQPYRLANASIEYSQQVGLSVADVSEGRGGSIMQRDGTIQFALLEALLDSLPLQFVPMNDTIRVGRLSDLEAALRTEEFRGTGTLKLRLFYAAEGNVSRTGNVKLLLTDGRSKEILATLRNYNGSRDTIFTLTIPLNYGNRKVRLGTLVQGISAAAEFRLERWRLGKARSGALIAKGTAHSEENTVDSKPTEYALHPSYPNPFNPSTTMKFDLPENSNVSLVVYDVLGRKVAELVNGFREAGYHNVQWSTDNGQLSSGVYFARFTAADAHGNVKLSRINKLLLTK
jgi:hypothetical protein